MRTIAVVMLSLAMIDLIIAFVWLGIIGLNEIIDTYREFFPDGIKKRLYDKQRNTDREH